MRGASDERDDIHTVAALTLQRVADRFHVPPWEVASQPVGWYVFGAALMLAENEEPPPPPAYPLQQIAGGTAHLLGSDALAGGYE